MARIELRHCVLKCLDGFSGTGAINEPTTPPADGDTDLDIDAIVVNGKLGTDIVPVDDAVITFLPQQINIKIGDGNLTYTENDEYEYELDRGQLDSVRQGDEVPMDVNLDFVYEFVTTGTGEAITPMDALKGRGGASEWVSSSADPCEPYAVDIEVEHVPPCGGAQLERTLFPDFRPDTKEFDLDEATVSVSGRCNAVEPAVTREDQ